MNIINVIMFHILSFLKLFPLFIVVLVIESVVQRKIVYKSFFDERSYLEAPLFEEAIFRYVPFLVGGIVFASITTVIWAYLHTVKDDQEFRLKKTLLYIPFGVFTLICLLVDPLMSFIYHYLNNYLCYKINEKMEEKVKEKIKESNLFNASNENVNLNKVPEIPAIKIDSIKYFFRD